MRVLALDLSLTRTGVADSARPNEPFVLAPPGRLRAWQRLHWIQQRVQDLLVGADLVVFEGYAMAARGRAVFAIGELGGVVKFTAWRLGVPQVDIAPSTLKKLATGKGNAPKASVLVEAVRRLGYDTGSDDNEADALWLLQAAAHHYGLHCRVELPKAHTATLAKIAWPEITSAQESAA